MTQLRRETDLDTLMRWRAEVLRSVFGTEPGPGLLEANRDYYSRHIPDGTHRAYIAAADGHDCGCGAICLYDEMPSPDNPTGRCGYIMNMYVRPPYRHRGIATALLHQLISDARHHRCGKIYLETTAMGRSVYSALGFRPMPDLLKLE